MKSVKTLLDGIIDYAGLFPPAKLELADALAQFQSYDAHPQHWLLARFVVPMARLDEVSQRAERHFKEIDEAGHRPWRFSVLARPAPSAQVFLEQLAVDLASAVKFLERHPRSVVIEGLELAVPDDVAASREPDAVRAFLERLDAVFAATPAAGVPFDARPAAWATFLEWGWNRPLLVAFEAMHGFNPGRARPLGVKLRTGGLTPDAVVSSADLAGALRACAEVGLAFKATAGLHQPLRHFDASVGSKVHGFFNVFVGAALLKIHGLGQEALRALLEDEDASHFVFNEAGVTYGSHSLPLEALAQVREGFAISFGSCSFLEPVEHLQLLGLVPR